jgi:hypothetical protein
MQIQDFNRPPPSAEQAAPEGASIHDLGAAANLANSGSAERYEVEIALLRIQIEHLELVVETARSLMTSNQERLLRRLHDLPSEMIALNARLSRFSGDALSTDERLNNAPLRRLA